jgi:hypothetical protein
MLLDEIIELLSSEQPSLTEALLKTKVLLHQIGKKNLAGWVNNELNGYPDEADVPDYRVLPSLVLANLRHMTFRATKHPIPLGHLSADKQELLTHTHMREPLVVLQQLHDASETVSERGIERPLPMELNFDLGKGLAPGLVIERGVT